MSKLIDVSFDALNAAVKLGDVRDSLRNEYVSKIDALTKEDWNSIKEHPKFIFRKFSIVSLVPKFRFSNPVQRSGSEEEAKLGFIDVQRILCYLLLGNDFVNKWPKTTDTDLGEPLYKEIIEKIKSCAEANDYDLYKSYFVVEKMSQKGDYSLKVVKRRPETDGDESGSDNEFTTVKHKTTSAKTDGFKAKSKISGPKPDGPKTYASITKKPHTIEASNEKSQTKGPKTNTSIPTGPCIESQTMEPMLAALDAMAKLRKVKIESQGDRTMMAIKLCQTASNLLAGK
jgi:hypothetical protein